MSDGIDRIKNLIALLEGTDVSRLAWETDDIRIEIERDLTPGSGQVAPG